MAHPAWHPGAVDCSAFPDPPVQHSGLAVANLAKQVVPVAVSALRGPSAPLLHAASQLQSEDWVSQAGPLPQFPRPLRLALPCAGVDGAGHALRMMGVPVDPVHVYDLNSYLRPALLALHGPSSANRLHLGPDVGDILRVDPRELEPVDGIVAGPPCPPFSSIGLRGGQYDPRADVFQHVVDMIVELGSRGALFFILENVPGVLHHHSTALRWPSLRGVQPCSCQSCAEPGWRYSSSDGPACWHHLVPAAG